ncbi:MAG: NUDIX hydrolase [Candidatus Pacebacteria bacterium]|nr:NUDIX hydrolase [Candidatus Paceibacterota bacterium]
MQKIFLTQKAIIVNENGSFLAIRRSKTDPARPLFWDLPGGGLDFSEDAKQGIIRETKEETGLDVENFKVKDVISRLNDRGEFWITIFYVGKTTASKVILSYEHDDYKWTAADEFLKLKISPTLQKFVEKFKS